MCPCGRADFQAKTYGVVKQAGKNGGYGGSLRSTMDFGDSISALVIRIDHHS